MKILTNSRKENEKYHMNHKYPKVGDMVWTVKNGIPKEMKVYDEFTG